MTDQMPDLNHTTPKTKKPATPSQNHLLTYCPACAGTISKKAPTCPHCGHQASNPHKVDLFNLESIGAIGCGILITPIIGLILFVIGTTILALIGASWEDALNR